MAQFDHEVVFDSLSSDIRLGKLRQGHHLAEVELANFFGVSRTPVRDALARLIQEGLAHRKGRRVLVSALDVDRVIQIYDLRVLLEVEAAKQAAQNRSLADVLKLQALIEQDRNRTDTSEQELISSNLRFHRTVWDAADNPTLVDLLESLSRHLVHTPHSTLTVGNRWSESIEEHSSLAQAIEDRDSVQAAEISKSHFESARKIRLELLRDLMQKQ